MNIFRAYFSGLRKAAGLPRPVILIYFMNLLLALLIVFPLYRLADADMGTSLAGEQLSQGFSLTVFGDFVGNNLDALKAMLSQAKWILLIYWLLSIFFAGGIIRTLNEDKFSMAAFFHGAGFHFFRFLGISLFVFLLHIILILIIYVPAGLLIRQMAENANETAIVYTLIAALSLHALLLIFLFAVNDYSKIYGSLNLKNAFKSFAGGFRYVWRNFGRAYFLYLFLLIIPAAAVYGYFWADAKIDVKIQYALIISLVLQQFFILLRIWFRIWIYASPLKMFAADREKPIQIPQPVVEKEEI